MPPAVPAPVHPTRPLPGPAPRWRRLRAAVVMGAVVVAGTAATSASGAVAALRGAHPGDARTPDAAGVLWLCRPGTTPDPCATSLTATVEGPGGSRRVQETAIDPDSRFDCFYVYPTVSEAPGANAPLKVTPAITGAAVAQAARFSSVCRVWAPVYRQRTSGSLALGLGADPAADLVAYQSLLSAWKDYLAHDNDGRPVVFIGHSQGAAMLIRLLRSQVDPVPALRKRLVAALIIGGNVTVPDGRLEGATFAHIPLCTARRESGCVIAYSSFGSEPPAASDFGRPGQGVSLQSGQTATSGVHVACVDPGSPGSTATTPLQPYFPATASAGVTTPWVTYPDLYAARCRSAGGATWLQVDDVAPPGDTRPTVSASLGPDWGYHADDVNLALGNLVADVAAEELAYRASHR